MIKLRIRPVALLVLAASLVGACTAASPGNPMSVPTLDVVGLHDLRSSDAIQVINTECFGTNGYEDQHIGSDVKIYDATGSLVATTILLQGWLIEVDVCRWGWSTKIPSGRGPYRVEIGLRQLSTFTEQDMQSPGWVTTRIDG